MLSNLHFVSLIGLLMGLWSPLFWTHILFINCVVYLWVCPSIEVPILGFRTSIDRRTGPFCRSRPFPHSNCRRRCCLKSTATAVSPPFSDGLPRVNTKVFFSRPFPAGCPGLIPRFFFFFPALFRWPAQG